VLGLREKPVSVVHSNLLDITVKRMRERGAGSTSDSLTTATLTKTRKPAPFPQRDLHPNSLKLLPILTALDSSSTLTYTTTMTSESEYSKYSDGVGSSPQRVPGPFLAPGEAKAVPNPTLDMEADGYDTPSDSGDDASQDRDSHEGKLKSPFVPPRQGLTKPQVQRDVRVESSSLGLVDAATTSVSESGTPSAPPSTSCVER
jgi:hypothetical protein